MLGLLGYGVVGKGVGRILDAMSTEETASFHIKKILVRHPEKYKDSRITTNVEEILNDPEIDTVVECLGGLEPAVTYVHRALEAHKNVVTSNKKMLAVHAVELMKTAEENHVSLKYEAACGGGIPWIAALQRMRREEPIQSFEGIFNGTTNYILSSMDAEKMSFEKALQQAQKAGYAEQDPSDDISGRDTCYKTVLSAMCAFDRYVNPVEVPCYGIEDISDEEWLYAETHGCTIRLLGKGTYENEKVCLSVFPTFVRKDSLFAVTSSNFNALCSESLNLGKACFIGQGAGSLPTAHAVVQDLLDLKEYRDRNTGILQSCRNTLERESVFYVRSFIGHERICQKTLNEHAFLTGKISFSQLRKEMKEDRKATVIEVEE